MGALTTAAVVGTIAVGGAISASQQYQAGKAGARSARRQGEYNAQVYEQQASVIQHKKKIEAYQYNREAGRIRGATIARTAGSGFNLGGSPLAIMIDNESQIQFDKAVGQYNLEVERSFAQSQAQRSRYEGAENARLYKAQGRAAAFSTILNTGASIAMMGMGGAFSGAKSLAAGRTVGLGSSATPSYATGMRNMMMRRYGGV